MRLFQNCGISPAYRARLATLVDSRSSFSGQQEVFLADRYGAAHLLQPVYEADGSAFFTNGDDDILQRAWASENSLPATASLADILLAQIEHHRTEVFYNLDPTRYDGAFVRRLPGHVKRKIAWRAAPGAIDFAGYDVVVCNFPSIRAAYEKQGIRTAELFPSHDPELDSYAERRERDIDVLFVGGYSRHHQNRRHILESIARLSERLNIVFHLDNSRYTRLAETPLGWFGPLAAVRRPRAIRNVAKPPVAGRAMYEQLGRAKIVINAAVDMAGTDRGNMRCFETMGAGAMLLTDQGNYPPGMIDGETMRVYGNPLSAAEWIEQLSRGEAARAIASRGHAMISEKYNKLAQFRQFTEVCGAC